MSKVQFNDEVKISWDGPGFYGLVFSNGFKDCQWEKLPLPWGNLPAGTVFEIEPKDAHLFHHTGSASYVASLDAFNSSL